MRSFLGAIVGGLLGLAAGFSVYVAVNPVLEESSGLLRETQGLLWNLVPLLTLVGAALGWSVARRRGSGP